MRIPRQAGLYHKSGVGGIEQSIPQYPQRWGDLQLIGIADGEVQVRLVARVQAVPLAL